MWPAKDFYPRSPCGERQIRFFSSFFWLFLSTLSLRRATGSLSNGMTSTSYFYPRSPCGERLHYDNYNLHCVDISIHALPCGERLIIKRCQRWASTNFYPRSPCGERLPAPTTLTFPGFDFYPRSPCGERREKVYMRTVSLFLSTLSLRRATRATNCQQRNHQISIHALLAESDPY